VRTRSKDHSPHVTDERFNTASHLVAAVFALLGGAWLIVDSSFAAAPWHIVGHSIYAVTLVSLFSSSTLHHGIDASDKVEERLRTLDYAVIYLLIAGTMTPICLVLIRGPLAWTVLGVSWAVALGSLALRVAVPTLPKWVSGTLYGALGALGVVLAWPVWMATDLLGVALVAIGGGFYTFGSGVFMFEKPNPIPGRFGFHEIWHVFVILGALFHFAFMALYVRA
jgi:hemolysin III